MKHTLICGSVFCGMAFCSRSRRQRYCSLACSAKKYPAVCTIDGCENAHRAKGLCSTHYNAKFLPGSQALWPGDSVRKADHDRQHTHRRRALMQGALSERVDRDVVGDRDGWVCGICHDPVDRLVRFPDMQCASLDHVVPLSRGGAHIYSNVRITHNRCNIRRNNRTEADDGWTRSGSEREQAAA